MQGADSRDDPVEQAVTAAMAADRGTPSASRAHALAADLAAPEPDADDLESALDEADRSSEIRVDAPTISPRPLVRTAKRVVQRATAWQLRHLADQVTVLAAALNRAVSGLADRVDGLDRRVDALESRLRALEDEPPKQP